MRTKRDAFLNNRSKRILIAVSAFLLMYLISYIIDPLDEYWTNFFRRDITELLSDCSFTLAFCIIISESSIFISNRLNKRLPWTESPGARFLAEASMNLVIILGYHLLALLACLYLVDNEKANVIGANSSVEETVGFIRWIVVSFMIAGAIIGINTVNYLVLSWKNAALKATELNQVAMEAELQSLKLQIDPHFVFNNLSVLSELILKDQQLGFQYAENFSKIYRYLLVNSKKNTIRLEDELKFLKAYIFLIEHRFGEAVRFVIDIDPQATQLYMPPLTLQLLVENVLKHNRTSRKEPLRVHICTNDQQELIVENALLPIEKTYESSGIGIRNIIRRYNLLSEKTPEIVRGERSFKVIVPLIKL
ncbi:MAG: histidine kinase [Mucilaginibacter polytrichastri]|nr:histidine kinase [Mucilaginibacter polytrichastri]